MVRCVYNSWVPTLLLNLAFTGLAHAQTGAPALPRATPAEFEKAGDEAVRKGDTLKAYLLYAQAAQNGASAGANSKAVVAKKEAIAASPILRGQTVRGVDPASRVASNLDPENLTAETRLIEEGEISESPDAIEPAKLEGNPGVQSFEFRGDGQRAIETVAAAFGIQVIFDGGYDPVRAISFRLQDADFATALRALETATDSFFVAVRPKIMLVARDTLQNRNQLSPTISLAVPIPERISVQEAQEMLAGVQQMVELRRISTDPVRKLVVFRDQAAKVRAAQAIFLALSQPRAQVVVDVELLSVSKSSSLNYGLSLPTSANIVSFSDVLGNSPVAQGNYLGFGGGASFMGIGIGDAQLLGMLTRSSAQSLLASQVVSLDGQAATVHVGDKYPITTASYTDTSGNPTLTTGFTPSITFEDLGFVLKITPSVHENAAVSLDIDAQFKTLGNESVNGIPVINSRSFQGKVRLETGQWGVVAGLVNISDSPSYSGILGLSQLPGFGRFLRRNSRQYDLNEMLLVFKPRIVNLPAWENKPTEFWVGSETKPTAGF